MRVMLIAFLAIAVITVAADFALDEIGFSSSERLSAGDSVRLD
jgi:hypothetical protein